LLARVQTEGQFGEVEITGTLSLSELIRQRCEQAKREGRYIDMTGDDEHQPHQKPFDYVERHPKSMGVKELKQELLNYGITTKFWEKSELEKAVLDARIQKQKTYPSVPVETASAQPESAASFPTARLVYDSAGRFYGAIDATGASVDAPVSPPPPDVYLPHPDGSSKNKSSRRRRSQAQVTCSTPSRRSERLAAKATPVLA
jgi:hypothetical protein